MNNFGKITMLVRREVWENRSLWIAPLVVSGVILFAAAVGGIHVGDSSHFFFKFSHEPSGSAFQARQAIYGIVICIVTGIQLVTLGIVAFFYLLDSLLAERKDRSILFWKSLPISDTQVVSSKVLTALVLAPVYVLIVSALTHLVFGVVWSLRGGMSGIPLVAFDADVWMQVQAVTAMMTSAVIVWYLPIAGYLLLVSVWVRKNAFLWAVLPLAALLLIEGMLMQSHNFGDFLARRFIGVFEVMGLTRNETYDSLGELLAHIGNVFTHYETWLGVLAAAAFFVAAVRIRRYRDDT